MGFVKKRVLKGSIVGAIIYNYNIDICAAVRIKILNK